MRDPKITERLEYLRGELRAERISWGELSELQNLASEIDPGDVELLEAAGVPEHEPDATDHIEGEDVPRIVVCVGNPFNGIDLYGPFEHWDDANEWAEREHRNSEWWTYCLRQPDHGPELFVAHDLIKGDE
jgi:hypothetical protein